MTGATNEGLIHTVDVLPLPKTRQGIVSLVEHVLSKPFVDEIVISITKGVEVSWHRALADSLAIRDPEDEEASVLNRVELQDFPASSTPRSTLFDARIAMASDGKHYPTHLFVASFSFVKEWLGLPSVVRLPDVPEEKGVRWLCGLRVVEVASLPEEVVVLMGGHVRNSTVSGLATALRLS